MKTLLGLTVVGALLLVGCDKGGSDRTAGERGAKYEGELTPLMTSILAAPQPDGCYIELKDKMLEVTRALDARRDELKAFTDKVIREQTTYPVEQLGPVTLIDNRSVFYDGQKDAMKDNWVAEPFSWRDIVQEYEKVKNEPVNQGWRFVESYARSVIGDDEGRILGGWSYDIERVDGDMLVSLEKKLDACFETFCRDLTLLPEEQLWIDSRPSMKRDWDNWRTAGGSAKADAFIAFRARTKENANTYHFRKNASVTVENDTLIVPVDGSLFAPAVQDRLGVLFREAWDRPDLRMQLRWVGRTAYEIYRFVVEATTGGRAFVSHSKKEIHLFTYTRLATYRHEMGHVIGLPDEYYTTWQAGACEYYQNANEARIMSANTGIVTPDNVARIRATYFR